MKRKSITLLALVFVTALFLSACSALSDAAKLTEYDFDTDKIPSINAVLEAERKVTGVSTGTSNGTRYREYTYETSSTADDLISYVSVLLNDGWVAIKDVDFNDTTGEAQIATESADEGKILIMIITFEPSEYIIRVEKFEGTLNRY